MPAVGPAVRAPTVPQVRPAFRAVLGASQAACTRKVHRAMDARCTTARGSPPQGHDIATTRQRPRPAFPRCTERTP
eukprot:11158057-Lingulodinium_polyedra.AAC.1